MPGPNEPTQGSLPPEDSFLELLAETLDGLDRVPRGQFLQRFFKTIAQLDLSETVSSEYWDQILERRRQLSDTLGKPISLKAAMVDVLASSSYLRVPILMEYEDLRKLQFNAATDPLTELYNRRLFEEHFEKELNRAQRYNQHLALVILDLHQFKEVNDRFGHPQGDLFLRTAAATLRKSLRTSDYAFRIGGDEFALLLVHSDTEQANTLARRIRANFSSAVQSMQSSVGLGLDYGIAVFPVDGDQKDVLVRVADQRLYEMKHREREAKTQRQAAAAPGASRSFIYPPAVSPSGPMPGSTPTSTGRAAVPSGVPPTAPPSRGQSETRKWERVSLAGTRAYAQLADNPQKTLRVIDLGYGGLALEMEGSEEIGSRFSAVLHVPILPPVRVVLKKLYQVPGARGQVRVGCAFVS
ncbi:MAG TPA: diguanylate cyclase [Candidatus Acidoferrales bacterium]|jgi:diguanylate cyclase (GGDEF)-like protein|nr:diguanylate cyclase [Candidatus Acidoferrales bacterium]